MYPDTSRDDSAPAGVWTVASDTAAPAEQLAEDTRWQQVSFGDISYEGSGMMQLRLADGELLAGTYERTDDESVEATLRPLREEEIGRASCREGTRRPRESARRGRER